MKQPTIAVIVRMAFEKDLTETQLKAFSHHLESLVHQQTKVTPTIFYLVDSVRDFKGSKQNRSMIALYVSSCKSIYDYPIIILGNSLRFKYDIEIRLDYDDTVSPDFIQDVVDQYHNTKEETFIVSYQPVIVDTKTGNQYRHPSKYSEDCPSMCMALIQKREKKYGVYDRPHNKMQQEIGCKVIVRPEGFFYLQVHGENTLSKLPNESYRIKN